MIDERISENANPALVLQIVLHKLTITTPVLVVESPGGPFEVLHSLSVDPAAGDMFPSLRFIQSSAIINLSEGKSPINFGEAGDLLSI
jgi:hypothetical protein